MLIPERKKLLVDALLSGKYIQGRGYLEEGELNCVLGVGARVREKETGHIISTIIHFNRVRFDGTVSVLPTCVANWYGLTDLAGDRVNISGHLTPLSQHNDSRISFKELAHAIDEQL